MSSTGFINVYSHEVRSTSTVKEHDLGTLGQTPDGRKYRYSRAGATALDPGKLAVAADPVANHVNRPIATAVSAGATEVRVTLGATAITLDQYADGFLVVNDEAGEGIAYRVRANQAGDASATVKVFLDEPLKTALTTSSEVSLLVNPNANVVISATDQADAPVGVPNTAVPVGAYFWAQTGGVCSVLADEGVNPGVALTTGTGVAGAVEALDAAGEFQIGVTLQALIDTEYRAAILTLD